MTTQADKVYPKLLATLRATKPVSLLVYEDDEDDDPREIAVPERRRRWPQIIASVNAFPWVKVEMRDKKGAVLGYVDNTPVLPVPDLRDLREHPATKPEASPFEIALAMTELAMRAQNSALEARDRETRALVQAQADVMKEMTAGMRSLVEMYQEQIEDAREQADRRIEQQSELAEEAAEAAAEQAEQAQAAAEQGGMSELKQFMEAWPVIQGLLPILKGMAANGAVKG
jgi:hypothetical protein